MAEEGGQEEDVISVNGRSIPRAEAERVINKTTTDDILAKLPPAFRKESQSASGDFGEPKPTPVPRPMGSRRPSPSEQFTRSRLTAGEINVPRNRRGT